MRELSAKPTEGETSERHGRSIRTPEKKIAPHPDCRSAGPAAPFAPILRCIPCPSRPAAPHNVRRRPVQRPVRPWRNKSPRYNRQWLSAAESGGDSFGGTHTTICVPTESYFCAALWRGECFPSDMASCSVSCAYIRFQTAPPGTSVISMPFSFSSSRMRSASAKFLAFLASPRALTRASISGSPSPVTV